MHKLDDIGDPAAPYGSREWCAAMRLTTHQSIQNAETKVGALARDLRTMRDEGHYRSLEDRDGALFDTWEDFVQYPWPWGLGWHADIADAVLRERDPMKSLARLTAERMAEAQPLAKVGRPSKDAGKGDDVTISKGSNGADYLAARIKRDAPAIAEAVERGEFRSMRQAAIAAGIVKERTPLDALRAAWRKASADERQTFREEIDMPVMDTARWGT